MWAIYKKELRQYFRNMIGFVFLTFFLAIIGIYTWAYNLAGGYGNFELTLGSITFLFVLLIPILTMRIIAEENHQKTDQLLYTSPVSITKIVLGKYLAVLTLFGVGILIIAFYPLLISHYGTNVQLGAAYSALLGFFLLGAAYIAIGLFISSLTESQMIAAVVSFVVLLLTTLMGSISTMIPSDSLSQAVIISVLWLLLAILAYRTMGKALVGILLGVLGEAAIWILYALKSSVYDSLMTKILEYTELSAHFDDFTMGILQYDIIFYYISVIVLCLFLTVQRIKGQRLPVNKKLLKGALRSVMTIAVLAVLVGANLLLQKLDYSTDLSSDSRFTLTDETIDLLQKTKDEITIYYMVQEGSETEYIDRVLSKYGKVSRNISVVQKDPVLYPGFAAKYVDDTVSNDDVIVVDETTGLAEYVSSNDMYYQIQTGYSSYESYLDVEGRVTSAIQSVQQENSQKMYCLTGHGESSLGTVLAEAIEKMNIQTEELRLATESKVPEDCDILLINGPSSDLMQSEKKLILKYMKQGGQVILLTQYTGKDVSFTNLDEILAHYGVERQNGEIYESAGYYAQYINAIVPIADTSSEITSDLEGYIIMPNAQGLKYNEKLVKRDSVSAQTLLSTSDNAYLKVNPASGVIEKEEGDLDGPFSVGLYIEDSVDEDTTTKLAVFSNAEFITDTYTAAGNYGMLDNGTIMKNTINSMTDAGEGVVSVDARSLDYSYTSVPSAVSIFWAAVLVILLPAGLFLTGLAIWLVRRRKG